MFRIVHLEKVGRWRLLANGENVGWFRLDTLVLIRDMPDRYAQMAHKYCVEEAIKLGIQVPINLARVPSVSKIRDHTQRKKRKRKADKSSLWTPEPYDD